MFSPEHKIGFRVASITVALGLGLTACGGDRGPAPAVPAEQNQELEESNSNYLDFTVIHTYTDSGKRITTYTDVRSQGAGSITPNVGYCDGGFLVEMPLQYSDGGNSVITRTQFEGCDDNKLTASDFPNEK